MVTSPALVKPKIKARDIWGEIKKHRGWYFIAFLLWGVPPVIATLWGPIMGSKTIPDWLAENGWPRLRTLVGGWVVVTILIAFVIVARSYLSAKRRTSEQALDPVKRDYLIGRLRDFINEANQLKQTPLYWVHFWYGVGARAEQFLGLYSTQWVARFKEHKLFALEQIIAELLDGVPIPASTDRIEAVKDSAQLSNGDHSQQVSVDTNGLAAIPETLSRKPRQLSDEQLQFLAHCLTAVRGSITVQMYRGDSEALDLGRQLSQVLRNSGWRVDWRAVLSPIPETGIAIKVRNVEGLSPENSALFRALKEIDLLPVLVSDQNLTETILAIGANTKVSA
jgi:hypothetical protein